jgi:hypothetical protein
MLLTFCRSFGIEKAGDMLGVASWSLPRLFLNKSTIYMSHPQFLANRERSLSHRFVNVETLLACVCACQQTNSLAGTDAGKQRLYIHKTISQKSGMVHRQEERE